MAKRKTNPIKSLKKKAWETTSSYVRQRDNGICATCKKEADWKEQDCGHYKANTERNQSLGGNALWYDLRNLNCQCFRCNRMLSGSQDRYAIFLESKYGHGILQELELLYNTYKKWTVEELENLIKEREELIKTLTHNR